MFHVAAMVITNTLGTANNEKERERERERVRGRERVGGEEFTTCKGN